MKICSVENCSGKVHGKSLCKKHYLRNIRHGNPLAGSTGVGEAAQYLESMKAYVGDDCVIWPYATVNGYGSIGIGGKTKVVTRILCEARHGNPPTAYHQAAHSCGNGHLGCCNPSHLRWATRLENRRDMLIHGTILEGDAHPTRKLSSSQVKEIRSLDGSKTKREIAEMYSVGPTAISRILSRKTWKCLDEPETIERVLKVDKYGKVEDITDAVMEFAEKQL